MGKARELPEWSELDKLTYSRAYRARVDRTLELLDRIAGGLPTGSSPARSRQRKGRIKLKEGGKR